VKLKTIRLKQFKRFDDLTIELGDNPKKIIALVGPNGCGKSSIFDAFEEKLKDSKNASRKQSNEFFSKLLYSINPALRSNTYNKRNAISITEVNGLNFSKTSFYIRSPYRFTSQLNISTIRSLPNIIDDQERPTSSIDLDSRLQENYERLLGIAWNEYQNGTKSGEEIRAKLLTRINTIINGIVDIKISNLGDVIAKKGQLYFEKGNSSDFPYQNLSSGEKEVVDIIVDLVVKTPEYNDTIFCIDEPELHLNTAIQRKLLIEIDKLIPDNCQLWVATHSVGFLRALQDDLSDKCSVLDFSDKDYFDRPEIITPMVPTRNNWQRIFQTALEDLTGLLAPKRIVYCEGRPDPNPSGLEVGLDADIYNNIFSEKHNDTLFVSSGGGGAMAKSASLALKVLSKAFDDVELYLLKDRDTKTDTQMTDFLDEDATNRILKRREIENYIFDKEILKKFTQDNGIAFDETRYDGLVTNVETDDLKPVQQQIQACCSRTGNISKFKRDLSIVVDETMTIFTELEGVIF